MILLRIKGLNIFGAAFFGNKSLSPQIFINFFISNCIFYLFPWPVFGDSLGDFGLLLGDSCFCLGTHKICVTDCY